MRTAHRIVPGNWRRMVAILFLVVSGLTGARRLVDAEIGFDQALKQANANLQSPEGRRYLPNFLAIMDATMSRAMSTCSQNTRLPVGVQLVFIISADGRKIRVLASGDDAKVRCLLREIRLPAQVPPPPRDQWAVGAALRFGS